MSKAERFFSEMSNDDLLDHYEHLRQNGFIKNVEIGFFETKLEWSNSLEEEMKKRTKWQIEEIRKSDYETLKSSIENKVAYQTNNKVKESQSVSSLMNIHTATENSIVIPFRAQISSSGNIEELASQLQSVIDRYESSGYTYVRMEQVDTYIAGSSGCFGIGATPQRTTTFHLLIFHKN